MNDAKAHVKFIGVFFECCRVYGRAYLSRDGSRYRGRCPRCLRPLRVRAGAEGTAQKFFRAV